MPKRLPANRAPLPAPYHPLICPEGFIELFGAILPGRPASKKNSRDHVPRTNRQTGKTFVVPIPNRAYREWEAQVIAGLFQACRGKMPRLDSIMRIDAVFYEHPQQRGDLGGYFDALCDALQAAHVVTNDRKFRESGLLKIERDAANPRVEFLLTRRATAPSCASGNASVD